MTDDAPNSGQTFAVGPGTKIGRYEVMEQIAAGGMAIIYKAYDRSLDRYVAVKQIAPHLAGDKKFIERFRQEAKVLARLSASQANIVAVHELIEQQGQLFIIMEYVEGTTLRQVMDSYAMPLQRGISIVLGVALGLKAMHSKGIVHRDLTPSNIMLPPQGGAKISDFGLIGHTGGRTSMPMGTTKYMAPEMFTGGAIDPRADVYSLGFIAYEMFCGPQVFARVFRDVLADSRIESVRWMHWHANAELVAPTLQEINANVPPLLSKIVERMMAKDPARRFPSTDQVLKWLRRVFVMLIQKSSLTEQDADKLNQEVESDISGPAQKATPPEEPAPAPPAAAKPEAEKTAPLPRRRWTKRQKLTYLGIGVGAILLGLIGFGIYHHLTTGRLERDAANKLRLAERAYMAGRYAEALELYEEVAKSKKYESLPKKKEEAAAYVYLARAGVAMDEQRWQDAMTEVHEAERRGVESRLVRDFRALFDQVKEVKTALKAAEQEEKLGNYKKAIEILLEMARKYPRENLAERIDQLKEEDRKADYQSHIQAGKSAYDNGDIDRAMQHYNLARSLMETPEVLALIKDAQNYTAYRDLCREAEEAEKAENWSVATEKYEKAYSIRKSTELEKKINSARAWVLINEANELRKQGLADQAAEKFVEAYNLDPANAVAKAEAEARKVKEQLKKAVKAGDDAMAEEDYQSAVAAYEKASRLAVRDQDKKEIQEKHEEALFLATIARGDDAVRKQDWDEATKQYNKALAMRPGDATVQDLLEKLEESKTYHEHLNRGDELLLEAKHDDAMREYEAAKDIKNTPQVNTRIRTAKYEKNLSAGRKSLATGKYKEAIAYFRVAQDIKDTDEVRELIRQAKEADAESKAGT